MGIWTKRFISCSILLFALSLLKASNPIFVPNKGQYSNKVIAKAPLTVGDVWICNDGFWFQFYDTSDIEKLHDRTHENQIVKAHVIRFEFIQANFSQFELLGNTSIEYYNFYCGNNATKWVNNVRKYEKIKFKNVYPGIDLEIFENQGTIKYDWICNKKYTGDIKWRIHGADLKNKSARSYDINCPLQTITETLPLIYVDNNKEQNISGQYVFNNDTISLSLQESNYKRAFSNVTIDPVLIFSTFSGSTADNFGCTGTYDDLGNGYAGGTVFNFGLPVTSGAVQFDFAGGEEEELGYGGDRDAAILKFNRSGNILLYCTYLGGDNNEQPHSMVVDSLNNLYIMGTTRSTDFPISANAYDKSHNGFYDFFVTKFNSTGTQILASTFVGGSGLDGVGADRSAYPVDLFPLIYNYADEFRGEIITDNNQVFIGGITYSNDFPNSFGTSPNTNVESEGAIFSLNNDLSQLIWSQTIGSSEQSFDAIYGIALGKNGDIFGTGGTNSKTLNTKYSTIWKNAFIGDVDGFLVKLNKNSGNLLSGRYYGTATYEQSYFVQTDNSGRPYIYGQTEGQIPVLNAKYNLPNTGQFIARFDRDLAAIELQSTFGANGNMPNLSPSAFLIDRCERIFISGWGGTTNNALYDVNTGETKIHRNKGNTRNLPISNDAIQKITDGSDFYVAVFSKNMENLAFATYFGGVGNSQRVAEEHVDGGTSRFDKKGIIYQSVCGGCRRNGLFPTTPTAYSPTMKSTNCNNALFKIDFENLNKKPVMTDTFIKIIATNNIAFTKFAIDPDILDTVNIEYEILDSAGLTIMDQFSVTPSQGIGSAQLKFNWKTTCNSASADTFKIKLMIFDCGCPTADTTYAVFRIVVEPTPIIPPPDAICVSYNRQSNKMQIEWPASTINLPFFMYFLLEKTNPNGSIEIVDTIDNDLAGSYLDGNVISPNTQNYCYQLIGVNICNVKTYPSIKFCTVRELNTPIESVHLISTSVFEDRKVDVIWEKSQEPDFKEFEVYKYINGGKPNYSKPYFVTTDTTISDSSFNVDNQSYCYEILVVDNCGHISKPSNNGCNVIISGTAKGRPEYYFDLTWEDYIGWDGGVSDWVLERKYENNNLFSPIITTNNNNRLFRDDKLDYDWGGYWYRVKGTENVLSGAKDYSAQTSSNWIYLIQPPEVWVPDAFTVNQDGLNEIWGTFPLFVREYNMKVYNRWGQKVWESDSKKQQWDALNQKEKLSDAVFAWVLEFKGWDDKTYIKTGTVTVIH